MKSLPLSQGYLAWVDDEDHHFLNQWKWSYLRSKYKSTGYAVRMGDKKLIMMHRVINKTSDGLFTDHINGNGLDNQKHNLRDSTRSENAINAGSREGQSVYKGVSRDKNRWVAEIWHQLAPANQRGLAVPIGKTRGTTTAVRTIAVQP
jgi:hypothetical protein